jgi:Zn finger protein HypA/HybF involved in hydrogenase expression
MMPKIIEFHCNGCPYIEEEIFNDSENQPSQLDHFCPMCGGILYKFDLKNNSQVWKWRDKK